jgi:hypothetical protein
MKVDMKDKLETLVKTKAGSIHKRISGEEAAHGAQYVVEQTEVDALLESWPPAPKKVAGDLIDKYGQPNEATPTKLIWHNNGPWKRTLITSDEHLHKFPTPHTDYITQTIDYPVPVERYVDVALFDGSCVPHRTTGEVSATCDNEAANFITINLLHRLVEGELDVEKARAEFAEITAAWALNREAPLAEAFQFEIPSRDSTGDPDEPILAGPMAQQTVAKVKDVIAGDA